MTRRLRGLSSRAAVPPFAVMQVLDRVAELRAAGRDVISLCAGEPSGGAPDDVHARAAAGHAERLEHGYTSALGVRELRAAIAGHYRRWYGLDVAPEQVAVTTGASGAFVLAFLAAFAPGARVALARPGYPAYRNILRALGCEPVELDCGPEDRFQPTVALLDELVASTGPIDGLIVASPANPTGTMVSRDELAALARWCAEHGARLISDEIYHGITYAELAGGDPSAAAGGGTRPAADAQDDPAHGPAGAAGAMPGYDVSAQTAVGRGACAWECDRASIVISSFSKYWGMTGWRLGWMLMPDELADGIDSLAGNIALCPPTPAQVAALGAFTPAAYEQADRRVAALAAARRKLLGQLDRLGWGPVAPADGAFYLWADIGARLGPHRDAIAWCRALLEDEAVALVPGSDFDNARGDRWIRLSFAAGAEAVAAAVERIDRFQRRLG